MFYFEEHFKINGFNMRYAFIFSLLLWHSSTCAITFFLDSNSCQLKGDTHTFKADIRLSPTTNDLNEKKAMLREMLVAEYLTTIDHDNMLYAYAKERFVINGSQRNSTTGNDWVVKQLHYSLHVTSATDCNEKYGTTTAEFITGERTYNTVLVPEKEIIVKTKKEERPLPSFSIPTVSNSSFFGVHLNDSKQKVVKQLGLASLELISGNKQILVYFRNHALHFINNKLIGYQYHRELLPMSLSNELNLLNQPLNLTTKSQKSYLLSQYLEPNDLSTLRNNYTNFETALFKVNSTQNKHRIISLQIGSLVSNMSKASPCFNFDDKSNNQFALLNAKTKLKMNTAKGQKVLISPCNEMAYFSRGYISQIKLAPPIATNALNLSALKSYFKNDKWQFYNLSQGDNFKKLAQLGHYDLFLDTAEFTSEEWDGFFYIMEDKLISATLSPNNYD